MTKAAPPRARRASWMARLAPHLATRRRTFVFALVLSVLGQGLFALLPLVQKVILDDAIAAQSRPLGPWLALLVALGLAAFAMNMGRRTCAARASLTLQHELRAAIHRKVNALDQARHDRLTVGDVMSRAASDLTLVQMFFNQLPMVASNVTMLVVGVGVMVWLSPLLSLVFLIFVPVFLVLAVRFRRRAFPASWNDQRLAGAVAGVVGEAVAGVRVVKAFAQDERELGLLVDGARALFGSRMRSARLTALYSSTLQALPAFAQLGVLALGGWLALRGQISLGVFLAFASYVVQLLTPVRLLSGVLASSQQARAGAERILELLELEPTLRPAVDPVALEHCAGALSLDRVSFGHTEGAPILRGLSLTIRAGERVGIVGPSGSGKSTLALLLARFYDPTAGALRLDGHDLRALQLDDVRRHVGLVFEESFLFSTTIAENIAFGRPDAPRAAIEEAARAAQIHDFIAGLPGGYETRVGERGYTLSGGQRQRIALARTLLAAPSILVLDDATSAIDARTEAAIFRALEHTARRRTTIFIAHRPSTLRLAERVIVLDRGGIVAEGTNEELWARCPLYRDLLTGPERDDSARLGAAEADIAAVDPRAWPSAADPPSDGARAESLTAALDLLSTRTAGAGGGGGGNQRDLGGSRAAFVPPTPELLASVAALPPARDVPAVDLTRATAPAPTITLRSVVRPFRGALAVGLGLVVVDTATTLAGPFLTGRLIDRGILARDVGALFALAGAFLAVSLLSWLNGRAMQVQTSHTAESLLFDLCVRSFAHLSRLSLDFYDRESSGRIMTRMTTDVEAFAQLLQQGLLTAVVSLLGCAGVMAILVAQSAPLALAAFVTVPPLVIVTLVFRHLSGRAYIKTRERISAVYGELQESLAGVRLTQAHVQAARGERRFEALSQSYLRARLRSMDLVAFYFPFLQLLSIVAKTTTLAAGARLIARGELTAGVLVAFLLYLDQFFTPLQQLSNVFDQWLQARVSLGRIQELLQTRSRTPEPAAALHPGRLRGDVHLDGVRFSYGAGPEVLRGVDLRVRPGETVALVGTTGAGKSTFVKLVARFYDPTEGVVRVDGHALPTLALGAYRRQLGYVPQEPFLFSRTIRSNIAYGRPDASDLEVERAARAVGAHAFIAALPLGYLTPVTQDGRSLSAGQRQLLCLARAALVDPALLILDEATSNLDLATEGHVRAAMRRVAHGRTTLLIAHRLQTARSADRIVLLEDGRIVEQGPHQALLQQRGRYAELWRLFEDAAAPGARTSLPSSVAATNSASPLEGRRPSALPAK